MPMPVEFVETELKGVLEVKVGEFHDNRGFFSETYSQPVWQDAGFAEAFLQDNMSLSAKGTLRGMHYQLMPSAEVKVVRCISGSLYDVILHLRPDSPPFGQSFREKLSADNRTMMYCP